MKRSLLAIAAVVAFSAPFAETATAHDTGLAPVHPSPASALVQFSPAAGTYCHEQLANDNKSGIISQNFEQELDAYDARGADDFTLTHRCTVSEVDVNGTYADGPGPAVSVNVTFFKSQVSGAVGRVIHRRHNQPYADPSGTGNFNIVLSAPVTFRAGTYWVAVQVNMDSAQSHGKWAWLTNNGAKGLNSRWRNHGDGWGTGCIKWTETLTCIPGGEGPDFAFALLK